VCLTSVDLETKTMDRLKPQINVKAVQGESGQKKSTEFSKRKQAQAVNDAKDHE